MYNVKIKKHLDKIFSKLSKKKPKQLEIIHKKLKQITEDPYRFKPLKKPLHGKRRVHIDKSFVLIYSIDEEDKEIILENYDHHDNIYKNN